MEDLKNKEKKYYKIMWAGNDTILWNMIDESPISLDNDIYKIIESFFNINDWKALFSIHYHEWLEGKNSNIYDINFKVNKQIIEILPNLNNVIKNENITIYYWFDVDRNILEDFEWKFCPITKNKLLNLDKMHENNFFISNDVFLVFPK